MSKDASADVDPDARLNNGQTARFIKKGSDSLLVWFGGINEPFFSEEFGQKSRHDCLFLRDAKNNWYITGVKDVFNTAKEAWQGLSALRKRYRFVCFAGQSSGAQAALYYGKLCGADMCLVFAPQIRNYFDGQCRMVPHVPIPDVYKLYCQPGKNPKVVLSVSRSEREHNDKFEWNDLGRIADFKMLDCVTLIVHPYDNHAVSVKLRADGLLYDFVDSMIGLYGLGRMQG